jgi:hypothetical protein
MGVRKVGIANRLIYLLIRRRAAAVIVARRMYYLWTFYFRCVGYFWGGGLLIQHQPLCRPTYCPTYCTYS